ncbi:MAG: SiaB family protein kinase, partial [Bacteroidia bacterium]
AETNMNITEETSKTQKRVYFVMVESLQNITRHQDINQAEENHAFFVVQNRAGEYNLTSANIVEDQKIKHLRTSLEKINSLNADELKDYYKYVLENTGLSDKGGAGLGLIEMARKSGNKLVYSFDKVDNNSSFFYFKTRITAQPAEESVSDDLRNEKLLHELSKQNHINMIYQGIFTQENLKSLLTMTEGSISRNDDLAYKRKVISIMVELLQNICNHSAKLSEVNIGSPGIIVVATNEKGCFIYSGNYINNDKIEIITNKIKKVNQSSVTELEELYSETILKDQEPGQKGAGLGFIDIKMKSGNDLMYSVELYNSDYSFITLTSFIPY